MLEYSVSAHRVDSHGSESQTQSATLVLDTDLAGRPDAFNPAQLLLASVAARKALARSTSSAHRAAIVSTARSFEPK